MRTSEVEVRASKDACCPGRERAGGVASTEWLLSTVPESVRCTGESDWRHVLTDELRTGAHNNKAKVYIRVQASAAETACPCVAKRQFGEMRVLVVVCT